MKKIFGLLPFCFVVLVSQVRPDSMVRAAEAVPLPPGIHRQGDRYVSEHDGMELVLVPAGPFLMGSGAGNFNERPVHSVYMDPFLIDVHEVTNAQFQRFVQATGHEPHGPWKRGYGPGRESYPVRFVTWYDAYAYAQWAGRTLPTEAMWEKAARGDSGTIYPWGREWRGGLARVDLDVSAGPSAVGSFPQGASLYGCMDMAGNVWEWVNDWYDHHYYDSLRGHRLVRNPLGPEDGAPPEKRFLETGTAGGNERSTRKVIRGGGWVRPGKENLRCAKRTAGNPHAWFNDTGFRCAIRFEPSAEQKE